LPNKPDAQVLVKQLLRCGTSVAANYRAVCRARSKAEFVAKIGIVVVEANEAVLLAGVAGRLGNRFKGKNRELISRG
jgi:four helix bundle protein